MYRPSMYGKHDETMLRFADLFHSCPACQNIEMRPNQVETFDNDGIFIDTKTGRQMGYDWEYRDRYFENCQFGFDSLGQYERKLEKPSIQIALQCDATETGIAVGWHKDWLREKQVRRPLLTDSRKKEDGTLRYTKKFCIYSFEQMDAFKRMIAAALAQGIYSSEIFTVD